MKVCSRCNTEKPFSEFFKNKKGKFGYRAECKSCNSVLFRHADPERNAHNMLMYRYGISLDRYNKLSENQHYCCAICGTGNQKLCVDHNHQTGEIRGLLCNSCNSGLGKFKDTPELIKSAYNYLIEKGHYGQEPAGSP